MSTEFGMIFLRVYDRWIHILRLALQNCDWMSRMRATVSAVKRYSSEQILPVLNTSRSYRAVSPVQFII
ncbi:uncharacterized protein LOC125499949 isoform X4 [Athalia rosae]|uniref:uncharacterized protein LOC125499949 isoform X4 n=1 Tax=Athalia rosae TaxID=37344 RepID=UPI0020341ECF|nr:uncharacterized protein LOC125499949 isoform X4 [Athalia rosae]